MKQVIFSGIVDKVKDISKGDGVQVFAYEPLEPISKPAEMCLWDIELIYNNYHISERFNSSMAVYEEDIEGVAVNLLTTLFHGYHEAKATNTNRA